MCVMRCQFLWYGWYVGSYTLGALISNVANLAFSRGLSCILSFCMSLVVFTVLE